MSQAFQIFSKKSLDLVILDLNLPNFEGPDLCREISKNTQIPIIILTALNTINDRLLGLELGADDYVLKPFYPKELETRIRSILKRTNNTKPIKENKKNTLSIAELVIDLDKRDVFRNDIIIKLTIIEFSLLKFLIENAGKGLSRKMILDNIWGYTPERAIDMRVVDVYISRLRSKIEENSNKPDFILTVRGTGYTFKKY